MTRGLLSGTTRQAGKLARDAPSPGSAGADRGQQRRPAGAHGARRMGRLAALLVAGGLGAGGCGQADTARPAAASTVQSVRAAGTAGLTDGDPQRAINVPPPRCSRGEPVEVAANPWRPSKRMLGPTGAVVIRLCRYRGQPALALKRSALVTAPSVVRRLVVRFDRLPRPRHVKCPESDDSEIVAQLAYPRHRVTIALDLTGCQLATNGNLVRSASGFATKSAAGPELLSELRALV